MLILKSTLIFSPYPAKLQAGKGSGSACSSLLSLHLVTMQIVQQVDLKSLVLEDLFPAEPADFVPRAWEVQCKGGVGNRQPAVGEDLVPTKA